MKSIKRYLNGIPVDEWPWALDTVPDPRPFVLQHALKNLLLTTPTARYKGFTRLIGAEELDQFQEHFLALCTRYPLPKDVQAFLNSFSDLDQRLAHMPSLSGVYKLYKKKVPDVDRVYAAVGTECKKRLPEGIQEQDFLSELQKVRDSARGKVFDKHVALAGYSEADLRMNAEDENLFGTTITDDFIERYTSLIVLATVQHIAEHVRFLDLGLPLLEQNPERCPFCGQPTGALQMEYVQNQRSSLQQNMTCQSAAQERRNKISAHLSNLRQRMESCHNRHIGKSVNLLSLGDEAVLSQLRAILVPKHEPQFLAFQTALSDVRAALEKLQHDYHEVIASLEEITKSINDCREDVGLARSLGMVLVEYCASARSYVQTICSHVPMLADACEVLKRELDLLAGTEDISILIELLERRKDILKRHRIQAILDNLSELRKGVDQYVTQKNEERRRDATDF